MIASICRVGANRNYFTKSLVPQVYNKTLLPYLFLELRVFHENVSEIYSETCMWLAKIAGARREVWLVNY